MHDCLFGRRGGATKDFGLSQYLALLYLYCLAIKILLKVKIFPSFQPPPLPQCTPLLQLHVSLGKYCGKLSHIYMQAYTDGCLYIIMPHSKNSKIVYFMRNKWLGPKLTQSYKFQKMDFKPNNYHKLPLQVILNILSMI